MTTAFAIKSVLQIELEGGTVLKGLASVTEFPQAIIILSQLSSNYLNNDQIIDFLNKNDFAAVSVDLLTEEEFEEFEKRYDVELLTYRLNKVIRWVVENYPKLAKNIGFLGSGKGAAPALRIAAGLNDRIKAIVCRSGRPDLVYDVLHLVEVPTLFVVGKLDPEVEEYNHQACRKMKTNVKFIPVNGASHLFSEQGKLNEFALEMLEWFENELGKVKREELV